MSFYVLKSPRGRLIEDTASPDKEEAWSNAFDYLRCVDPDYVRTYWKQWESSIKAAKKMGWTLVRAKLTEIKPATKTALAKAKGGT